MNDVQRILSIINHNLYARFNDVCESLGGWNNDAMRTLVLGGEVSFNGETFERRQDSTGMVNEEAKAIDIVRLVHFDEDFQSFMFVQAWDRRVPFEQRRWEYLLLFNNGANEWVPEVVCGWGHELPSYAEVGATIDLWHSR